MFPHRWGRILAAWILLPFLSPAAANSPFSIEDARLVLDGRPFVVRGVVYSNVPIGGTWADSLQASECLYARDFPLIAGTGANTVRTLAQVPPGSRPFSLALAANDLYWLAGFPLDRFFDIERSLSAETAQGRELRSTILEEFRAFVEAWKNEPRLLAFVFGNEVDVDYDRKFAGSAADFFSLLGEAAEVVREAAGDTLLTTSVGDVSRVGAFNLGTNDPSQPRLSFWSVHMPGQTALGPVMQEARSRTAKPLLVSSFGVDAYDGATQAEAPLAQADAADTLANEITLAAGNSSFHLLGGVWAALLDEWWRGGPDPSRHGAGEVVAGDNEAWQPAWAGLFGVSRGAIEGFDNLRPREPYFALARAWGGRPPAGLSLEGPPIVDPGGVTNTASGFEGIAPGGLFTIRGESFAAGSPRSAAGPDLPFQLGDISVCVEQQPAPLYFASRDEIRAQLPWETPLGSGLVMTFRAGESSQAHRAEVLAQAPGIFEGAVFRPGLPCPVDGANGVRPGDYLEVYGTGLGVAAGSLSTGRAATETSWVSTLPEASLDDRVMEVIYSGLLAGTAGVYQTNARIPADTAPGVRALRLRQNARVSNAVPVQIVGRTDSPGLLLDPVEPGELLVQAGGAPAKALLRIRGRNSFCGLVRFDVAGLPAGVRVSIPIGFPGQAVPLSVWAEPTAPRAEDVPVALTALSSLADTPRQTVRVTVLPALGDIRLRVVSGGWLSGAPAARFEVAGRIVHQTSGGGPGRGFNFLTINAQSGELSPVRSFDTWGSEEAVEAMETYLQSLPVGEVVLGAIADDGSLLLTGDTRRILREVLGSELLDSLGYQSSWAIIGRVGAARPIAEGLLPDATVVLERTVTFPMP